MNLCNFIFMKILIINFNSISSGNDSVKSCLLEKEVIKDVKSILKEFKNEVNFEKNINSYKRYVYDFVKSLCKQTLKCLDRKVCDPLKIRYNYVKCINLTRQIIFLKILLDENDDFFSVIFTYLEEKTRKINFIDLNEHYEKIKEILDYIIKKMDEMKINGDQKDKIKDEIKEKIIYDLVLYDLLKDLDI